ncbi:MAG: hybrid sensor histidine kinase/response regulator, partial [Microcystis panniformis]
MMKPDSDHLFNEDLEQLLESLEDKNTDGDETLDELSFLFEQTSPPAARYGTSLDQTLSFLPLEPELAELFGDSIHCKEAATHDLHSTRETAPKSEPEDGDDLESLML